MITTECRALLVNVLCFNFVAGVEYSTDTSCILTEKCAIVLVWIDWNKVSNYTNFVPPLIYVTITR